MAKISTKKQKAPEPSYREQSPNEKMKELPDVMAKVPHRPKSTLELLDTAGKELAAAEAYAAMIHNFLSPSGELAPIVEALPADPNSRLVFIIGHIKTMQGNLQSVAHMLGAIRG